MLYIIILISYGIELAESQTVFIQQVGVKTNQKLY